MLPADLKPEMFRHYPPEAQKLAEAHVATFRSLPLSFLPSLLREIVDYDFDFPAERKRIENELNTISGIPQEQFATWFGAFAAITLSHKLEHFDWVNSPAQFVEQLSAHLWATHQLDAFRRAATAYADRLRAAVPPEKPAMPRLGITIIGQGVDSWSEPLFRKLRPYGAYFSHVNPTNGLNLLVGAVSTRAKTNPIPYAHWYIDGGNGATHDPALTYVSYADLNPVRRVLLGKIQSEIAKPGMGPETLRTYMAQLRPADLGMNTAGGAALDHFQVKLFTEGSGTQIFSTTFVLWAAREALRRAEPLTMLVRYSPRQRQKPMNELLSPRSGEPDLDPTGSLVDADMGAYYNWINQQRLSGEEQSSFLVWFEGHNAALVIGPSVPRGTESTSVVDLQQLLKWTA